MIEKIIKYTESNAVRKVGAELKNVSLRIPRIKNIPQDDTK